MKILHIYKHYEPDAGYEENYLPAAQAELGAEVAILTSARHSYWGHVSGKVSTPFTPGTTWDKGVQVNRLPDYFELRRWSSKIALKHVGRAITQLEPDMIHLHIATGILTLQTLVTTQRKRIPIVVDSHIAYFNLEPMSFLHHAYYWLFRRLVVPSLGRQVRAWMPTGPGAQHVLEKELAIPAGRITHMVLGTDVEERPAPEAVARLRAQHGIGEDAVVFLFAGRVTPNKHVDRLIDALADALPVNDWHIVVVGPIEDSLRAALVAGLSRAASEKVLFTGEVDQQRLVQWLELGDVGVWPGEPGITVVQGMGAGLPLVLLDDESTRPYINGNGYAVGGDITELREILTRLGRDAELRDKMSRSSRDRAKNVFSWDSLARRSLQIYEDAMRGVPPSVEPLW